MIYTDLFAVLCPTGPLRMLIAIAEERQEDIPALIYSAGMASLDNDSDVIGGYRTHESNSKRKINWSSWLPSFSKSKGYTTIENEEEASSMNFGVMSHTSVNELDTFSRSAQHTESEDSEDEDEDDQLNAIKLGLGDFIFYSVLVGKAAKTDEVTLCLCIIAILTVS